MRALIDSWAASFLRLVGTLDGYVLRRFLVVWVANLFSFSLVFILLDLFEKLDEFSKHTEGFVEMAGVLTRYYGALLPIIFCKVLGPIVTLTAGLFTITLFQRSNEIVPMLANGRSYPRLFLPMILSAVVLAVLTFAVQEFWIPGTRDALLETRGKRGDKEVLKDRIYRDIKNDSLILIKEYKLGERRASGVTVFPVGRARAATPGGIHRLFEAESMRWIEPELEPENGYWLLEDGWVQTYEILESIGRPRLRTVEQAGEDALPLVRETFAERRLETTLIPQDLEVQEEQVLHMNLSQLRRKMESSVDEGWAIQYWSRFLTPLGGIILLITGLPVIVYFGARNIFFGALVAACIACAYFLAGAFFEGVVKGTVLTAAVGVALTPLGFLALGITWLRGLRS